MLSAFGEQSNTQELSRVPLCRDSYRQQLKKDSGEVLNDAFELTKFDLRTGPVYPLPGSACLSAVFEGAMNSLREHAATSSQSTLTRRMVTTALETIHRFYPEPIPSVTLIQAGRYFISDGEAPTQENMIKSTADAREILENYLTDLLAYESLGYKRESLPRRPDLTTYFEGIKIGLKRRVLANLVQDS